MKTKDICKNLPFILLFISFQGIKGELKAQTAPLFKTTSTEVHRAVLKDSAWTAEAIIDRIHFVRYDQKGRIKAENSLDPKGNALAKILYVYDKDGRIIEEITASSQQGGVQHIYQYFYDSQGRLEGKKQLNASREVLTTDTILRNSLGLVCCRLHNGIYISPKKEITKYIETVNITYDEEGKVTQVFENNTLNKNVKPNVRKLSKNDTIPLKRFSEGSFIRRYKTPKNKKIDFVYDEFGNWTKRTEYDGTTPEYIITRDIVYAGENNDWGDLLLNGKVKSVCQTSYVAIPKGPQKIDKGEKKGTFFTIKFDKEGRKISEEHFSETGILQGSTEYEYNENNEIQKEIHKSASGKIEKIFQCSFSNKGSLRHKSVLNANGELVSKGVFRSDYEGNCVNEFWFNPDGTKISEFHYIYDPYGQLIDKEILVPNETNEEYKPIKYRWNTHGRIAHKWIGWAQQKKHYSYQYSSRGEIVSGTEPGEDQTEVSYMYKFAYDDKENWKTRIKYINNTPVIYEDRIYTYYD